MNARELLAALQTGQATLEDVQAWRVQNEVIYRRPGLSNLSELGPYEAKRRVDAYCEWEDLARDLAEVIREASSRVLDPSKSSSEVAVVLAKAVRILVPLLHSPKSEAKAAFNHGYALWRAGRPFDAAEALAVAAEGLREGDGDLILEMSALSYLSQCLLEDKRFDEALESSKQLRERAAAHGFSGYSILAVFDRGRALASLGEREEALHCLKQAVDERRMLSEDVARKESVPALATFLNTYGESARKFGQYEEAVRTFRELAETQQRAGETDLQARAISDIGYTYEWAGEKTAAVYYLTQAADIAERAGDMANAARWRTQAGVMCGKSTMEADECRTSAEWPIPDGAQHAYALNVRAQQLVLGERYTQAISLGKQVLNWARLDRDSHLEISVRNMLGVSYMYTDEATEATAQFHKAIRLADGTGEMTASLNLRYNLAKAYVLAHDYQAAHDVLVYGIAQSQQLLSELDSSEFRQEVMAGSTGLYEMLVLLLSHADQHGNHMEILATADAVACQNLLGWLDAEYSLEMACAPSELVALGRSCLRRIRRADVELEVRHLVRQIPADAIDTLRKSRVQAEAEADAAFVRAGLVDRPWKRVREFRTQEQVEAVLQELMEPGAAVLRLFTVPEGVSYVLAVREGQSVRTSGRLIPWGRDEQHEALAHWTGNAVSSHGRGVLSLGPSQLRTWDALKSQFDVLYRTLEGELTCVLAEVLDRVRPAKLAVVPQGCLALLPHWQLADLCPSVGQIVVAPSLDVLRVCNARKRPNRGPTVLVPDLSNSLPFAPLEMNCVKLCRDDSAFHETESVAELQERAGSCSLMHVVAHGLFNVDNPYHSGFLAGVHESEEGLLVQYADPVSLRLQSRPDPEAIRLMTVAECMTTLSLGQCSLAVLSTCESGIPRQHGGGELTGLPNALLIAGAKSVIASLWRVSDAATAVLMHYFYGIWEGGSGSETSPGRALALARQRLRHASREKIRDVLEAAVWLPPEDPPYCHPFFSDAFQCYGSW